MGHPLRPPDFGCVWNLCVPKLGGASRARRCHLGWGWGQCVCLSVPIWKVLLTMVLLPLGPCEWCGHLTLPTSVFEGHWCWAVHWQATKSPALTEPLWYIGSSSESLPYSGPHFIPGETGILGPLPAATVSSRVSTHILTK